MQSIRSDLIGGGVVIGLLDDVTKVFNDFSNLDQDKKSKASIKVLADLSQL